MRKAKKVTVGAGNCPPVCQPVHPPASTPATSATEPADCLGTAKIRRLLEGKPKMKKLLTALTAVGLALAGTLAAFATQDSEISLNEVRDPRKLKTWLEANASDAETRLAALGSTAAASLALTNSSEGGTCYIDSHVDQTDDAGDYWRLLWDADGNWSLQTDADSQGTLATKLTISKVGVVTMKGSATLDNSTDTGVLTITETLVAIVGALDANSITVDAAAGIDVQSAGALKVGATTATSVTYGSASVTAHTFTSDGTGSSEIVLPAGSIDGTEILDGTIQAGDIGDSELSALAGVSSGANRIPYFTGAGTAGTVASSANVITFLAAADNAAMADIIGAAFTEGDLANSIIVSADIKDGDIAEADLKVVDTASDEDFLTYEVTTGDFEWHSAADVAGSIAAAITSGQIADGVIVLADLASGSVSNGQLTAAAVTKSKIADEDHGDFTYASGTATIDAGAITLTKMGDNSVSNSQLTAAAVTKAKIADEDHGDFTYASGTATIDNNAITSAKISDGVIVDADIAAGAAIAQSKLACSGVGDVVAAAASSTETADGLVVTVITFTNVSMVATDGTDEGESVQVFDFDAGAFTILSAVLNVTCTVSAGANTGNHYISMGTVAAADDSDLTSTEADVIPKTTLTENGALVGDAVLSATIVMDGTGTAKDLYFNWAIDDDSMNANTTNTVTGTLTLITTKAIDN